FSGPKTSIICSPMTSLKTSIKTITYLSDIGCLEIQGASLHSVEEAVMLSDRVCLLGGLPSTITDTFDIDIKRNQRTKESISSLVEKISTTLNERIAACA
ncbi:hypothetical protein ACNPNG_10030, partial [Klebsiella variicola]